MSESIDGSIEEEQLSEELDEQKSWISSGSYEDLLICPRLRSYSSLDSLSCSDKDEEECRLVNLNNVIKKLIDTIDDPSESQDVSFVCCLLGQFLKYNGTCGFYAKHLPQIGEILEFLSMQAKKVDQYLDYLEQLLELCSKPLLLQEPCEILDISPKVKRYFSLLGYLLILVPTENNFLAVKKAIERLLIKEEDTKRKDTVGPDVRHEAMEQSRLPLTLGELTEVASTETYLPVLQLTLACASVSWTCCHRMLAAGIENRILMRLHPAYECGCECAPVTEHTNLLLDKEDYLKTAECATKILSLLMTSLIAADELPQSLQMLTSPSQPALWSLRAAFRRELLRAHGSSRSRKLRNGLANLISAGLARCPAKWDLVGSGIVEDLALFFVATEYEIMEGWAKDVVLEVDNTTGLEFKKTLLDILAKLVKIQPESVTRLKNKNIVSGLLQIIEPSSESAKMFWNSEQLWHLLKYASKALTYLAPKIPDEFIEDNGSLRMLSVLERFMTDDYDNVLVAYFTEMICSLSLANCDIILNDFREHGFIPVSFKFIRHILSFEALTMKHQKFIAYLLVAVENILSTEKPFDEGYCKPNIGMAIDLLQRCLHQKLEDSELETSFLVAIGSFACECVKHCSGAQSNFFTAGGLYLSLDIVERAKLPTQNLYLSLLAHICENEFCRQYLFSWRCVDKRKGILSLLANIWREEERIFGVERAPDGCIQNTPKRLLDDDDWLYLIPLKSICGSDDLTTTAVRSVRPKIHYIHRLVVRHSNNYRKDYYKKLFNELSVEDQITILVVQAYAALKSDEAFVEWLIQTKLIFLAKSVAGLQDPVSKIDWRLSRRSAVREHQEKLLEKSRACEAKKELELLERIRHSKLNPAFDALQEFAFVVADSVDSYRLEKVRQMKTMKDQSSCQVIRGPLFETCTFEANDTDVFNKDITIQSIPKACSCSTSDEASTIRLSFSSSHCSLASISLQSHKLEENRSDALRSSLKIE